jgi:hypothetical protein
MDANCRFTFSCRLISASKASSRFENSDPLDQRQVQKNTAVNAIRKAGRDDLGSLSRPRLTFIGMN